MTSCEGVKTVEWCFTITVVPRYDGCSQLQWFLAMMVVHNDNGPSL